MRKNELINKLQLVENDDDKDIIDVHFKVESITKKYDKKYNTIYNYIYDSMINDYTDECNIIPAVNLLIYIIKDNYKYQIKGLYYHLLSNKLNGKKMIIKKHVEKLINKINDKDLDFLGDNINENF